MSIFELLMEGGHIRGVGDLVHLSDGGRFPACGDFSCVLFSGFEQEYGVVCWSL